jgi:hypothetical protein
MKIIKTSSFKKMSMDSRQVWVDSVRKNPLNYSKLPDELKKDPEIYEIARQGFLDMSQDTKTWLFMSKYIPDEFKFVGSPQLQELYNQQQSLKNKI